MTEPRTDSPTDSPRPMDISAMLALRKPGRKPRGMAAVLLPFETDGAVAVDAFQRCVRHTLDSGLTPAINMDTGYANHLTDDQAVSVLEWTREVIRPGESFVAGAYIERRGGDIVGLYRRQMDAIASRGGMPILFQTERMHAMATAAKVRTYAEACRGFGRVLGFELGEVFAPNGEIWDDDTFAGMIQIPEMVGAKHSSLDRMLELRRLAIRDRVRPEFGVYTGNDLGIDMIEYGSDYLLGLATFCPEKFAERDRLWAARDPAYYPLADALQYLGNVAFRDPVPAYKHSAAVFLHRLGRIPSPKAHPFCPKRPEWEPEILEDCVRRLGLA